MFNKIKNSKIIARNIQSYLLCLVLLIIYISNLVIIFRPSLDIHFLNFVVTNEFFIGLITLSYPLYLIVFYLLTNKFINSNLNKNFILFFIFLNSISFLLAQVAQLLEFRNFPNYLYSTYHIYIPYLIRFSYYQIGIVLIGLYAFYLKKTNKKIDFLSNIKHVKVFPKLIVMFFLILLVYKVMIIDFVPAVIDEIKQQVNANGMRVDFKYRATDMPQLSIKSEFIRKYSSIDTVIVNPPQSWDYSDIGNQVLIRYFLFPRKLVSYSKLDEYLSDLRDTKTIEGCKMNIIFARSYVDKDIFFPDSKFLNVKSATALYVNGDVRIFPKVDNKKLREIATDEEFLIGLIEPEKCIQF